MNLTIMTKPLDYFMKCLMHGSKLLDKKELLKMADELDFDQRKRSIHMNMPNMNDVEKINSGQILIHGDSVAEIEIKSNGQRVVKYTPYLEYMKSVKITYSIQGENVATYNENIANDMLVRREYLFKFDKNIDIIGPEQFPVQEASFILQSQVKKLKKN